MSEKLSYIIILKARNTIIENPKTAEHIISFGESFFEQDRPFYIEMAGITYPDPNYHITRKNSYIHCFEFVTKGQGIVTVDDVTNYPSEGDMYILPKGKDHDYRSDAENPFEKIWFNVSGNLCDELIHVYGIMGTLVVKGTEAFPLFREFLDVCEDKSLSLDDVYSRCSIIFHRLMIKLHNAIMQNAKRKNHSPAAGIKSYIDRNIYEKLTMDLIADHVNLSVSQINRVFKKAYGIAPYDYVLTRKIETAKLLLKNTSLSIKETAYRLNFADEHYFSNVFLQKTGMRPKEFNKEPEGSP